MKSIFLLLFLVSLAYSQLQTVRIGEIDKHYAAFLSKEELRTLVDEIEYQFESQLGFNVFDYAKDGIPIDIVYLKASKKKQELQAHLKKSASLKNKIDTSYTTIAAHKKSMKSSQKKLNEKYHALNRSIEDVNAYVDSINKNIQNISPLEYKERKTYIVDEQKSIENKRRGLQVQQKKLDAYGSRLQEKIAQYNQRIKDYKRIQRDAQKLSKTMLEVKGITKGKTITTHTFHTQNGETDMKTSVNTRIQKIEIYDFENLSLLKVILAHELGHLVGVKHINSEGALMNPLLQEKQLKEFFLSDDDIKGFYKAFE